MWNHLQVIQRRLEDPTAFPASVKTAQGTKWGYVDERGQFVIPPQFDYAEDFQNNGLAIVTVRNKSGVINRTGRFVIPPLYESITQFSEGLAQVITDQGFQVIDESGTIRTKQPYSYISMYQEGRAVFYTPNEQNVDQYGYLDRQGNVAIPAQFQSAGDFHNGKAVVQLKQNEYALINLKGERLHTYPYLYVGPLRDGLLAFQQASNNLYGYINERGEVVIAPTYASAQAFEAGRAVVNTSQDFSVNQYGLIDKKGRFIIKPEYNMINLLGQGRVAVGKVRDKERPYLGSKYAIADTDGHFLTDFIYNDVQNYQGDYASAANNQYTFFIDRRGKVVQNLPIVRGNGTLSFLGRVIKGNVNQRVTYYNRSGKLIWKQNTIIPLSNQYRVIEKEYYPNIDYYVYYPEVDGMKNKAAQDKLNQQLKDLSQVKPIPPSTKLDYSYSGDFSVEFFRKQLLVMNLSGYNFPFGAAHGMPSQIYVNVDLTTGQIYGLKDLFKPGSDYVQVLSDIIAYQIQHNPEYSYVWKDSYQGIKPDQPFYVNERALFIYFTPYEIAPYAAGFPTFTILFQEIMNIIDTQGSFWRAFH